MPLFYNPGFCAEAGSTVKSDASLIGVQWLWGELFNTALNCEKCQQRALYSIYWVRPGGGHYYFLEGWNEIIGAEFCNVKLLLAMAERRVHYNSAPSVTLR